MTELFFRTFKQTFGRRKLRSRSAENARRELDWSLMALWSICLLGQREQRRAGGAHSPLSPAGAIRAVQATLRDYRCRPESPDETLEVMLAAARLDDYQRASSKTSRNYPRRKQRERTGAPLLLCARPEQINTAQKIKTMQPKFRSAA